ncbi:MAG TPA: PP2C family protein-serine/threonine phosphatase [Spirochaetota bacterium]|nr:PP2C family protein-serine/threonine phosphatase [Spirochaetota bacterium]
MLKYARAGHPYPVLIRNGVVSELLSGGGAIGIDSYMKYDETSIQLEPGDKILSYTDGLTEETDSTKEMFMDKYFQKVLPALASMKIDDVVSISCRRLIEYCGSKISRMIYACSVLRLCER